MDSIMPTSVLALTLTLRLLMSYIYIYGAPILDVSRSHTTCVVRLSGRGLCDVLITRPEESYRLCCVVVCDLETSRMGAPYIYMTLVA